MAADTPPTPRISKPSPKGMAQALKDPKVLVAVAVVGVIMALYFRSRQNQPDNLPVSDGSLTPIGPDYNGYYPDETQGAVTGGYGGYDSPEMNMPDWLLNAPNWVLDPPTWWGNEPSPTNSSDPSMNGAAEVRATPVVFAGGQGIYDPTTGQAIMAPVTGGGPPTTPNHSTPPKPANGGKPSSGKGAPIAKNTSGNDNNAKRYKVVIEKVGKHKVKFHKYESKPGKGDWGKGGAVNMGRVS